MTQKTQPLFSQTVWLFKIKPYGRRNCQLQALPDCLIPLVDHYNTKANKGSEATAATTFLTSLGLPEPQTLLCPQWMAFGQLLSLWLSFSTHLTGFRLSHAAAKQNYWIGFHSVHKKMLQGTELSWRDLFYLIYLDKLNSVQILI